MEQVVNLDSRTYSIHIETDILSRIAKHFQRFRDEKIFIISDVRVSNVYGVTLTAVLKKAGFSVELLTFPEGESSKSVETVSQLWQALVKRGIDRHAVIVALGGGVSGDVAGFLAATILRGVRFVQIPTSLLAQVDSSVGGKVGINLPQAKNIVGAFWQPSLVLIDPHVLGTLEPRQFNSGMAEVIKYGVIMDKEFFLFLESNVDAIKELDSTVMCELIAKCCQLKARIVEEDETETSGRRAILNYGHTFGHAIENVFGYGVYLHGEAIAIGMTLAAKLAIESKHCDKSLLIRQTELFHRFDLPTELPGDLPADQLAALLDSMRLDKKSTGGRFNLILPCEIGRVEFTNDCDETLVRKIVFD